MKKWTLCDAHWILLGVTIALVSLIPALHQTPWQIVLSLGKGLALLGSASVILVPALFFSLMQRETGTSAILMRGLARFVPDRDLCTLFLVLGVGPCLEAFCGSGFGAIVILPLLVRLHENTLKAVQLSLLSQSISLGLGATLATNLAGFPVELLSMRTAFLLFPSTIGISLVVLLFSGGRRALERSWCVALLAGSLFIVVTCLCCQFFMIEVSGILASTCVIALLLVWSHLTGTHSSHSRNTRETTPLLTALLPFLLLITGIFGSRFFPATTLWLQTHAVFISPAIKIPLSLLSHPGLWLLLATLVHIPLFSVQSVHPTQMQMKTWRKFLPTIIAMVNVCVIAALMQDSGMIETLYGTTMMLGKNAVWVAPLVGAVGGWITNPALGSNTLTIHLQMNGTTHMGFSLPWLIAAQNISAAMASAVSPARILLFTACAGLVGKELLVVRKIGLVLLWSLALTTLLMVWFTSSLWFEGIVVLLALLIVVSAPILLAGYFGRGLEESNHSPMSIPSSLFQTRRTRIHHPAVRWGLRIFPYGGLLLVNILYASYSLVSIGPLLRIDPVLFVCFQTALLAPLGFVLLLKARKYLNQESISRGLQLGGFLSAELLCYTHSLKNTGMTETMVFSTLNGIVATFIAWKIFGQRISTLTRWACLFALGGAGLVWYTSPARWQGDFTAFMSGVCVTGYSFHIEQLLTETSQRRQRVLPVLGVQFLTLALTTLVIALCFGQWQTLHFLVPSDVAALVYLSLATILLPCLILLVTQRSLSAITVAFFSVIEPIAGASFAFFSAGERLPMLAYLGGGIVLIGIVLQVFAGTGKGEKVSPPSDFVAHSRNARVGD